MTTKKIEDKDLINDIKSGNAAVRISGRDSEILLDGVSFKNNSNDISVNGLSINIKDKTNENIDLSQREGSISSSIIKHHHRSLAAITAFRGSITPNLTIDKTISEITQIDNDGKTL